ncbi:DUF4303 domain-containing protein [Humisphaera borealis]|uniref:DUF4303 domain-containing protein n=1 Tax=Humisphaera borealis TaxID=2807512 RepID=A0A7M2WU55_9BACT|nr:DUF4303 domain-containing protein [Humisphaera borealis]QOV89055.1 DUF4303 domain-containing protein [Humisphaera borealis]
MKDRSSIRTHLAEQVAREVADAFERFALARKGETITALALCSVDDAVPPYGMGGTLSNIGPITGKQSTWHADPADWSWADPVRCYDFEEIIGEILDDNNRPFEERAEDIFEGMVGGLKRFDGSGKFRGTLPREQMLLMLWIHDPLPINSARVMRWVAQLNPPAVSQWFNAVYPYRN